MTRPQSGPRERRRPFRRRSFAPLLVLPALVVVATVAAGCIGGAAVDSTTAPSASIAAPSSPASSPTASAVTSIAPSPTPTPTPSSTPTPTPTSTEDPSTSSATADVCTGTADNKAFFADAAERYPWPVYCPVLPARWNVGSGSFRSGRLDIGYNGPGGATLALHQGDIPDDPLAGTESGDAPFGDQTGILVALDDGGWAIVVDRGANPSWQVDGHGMDETTFRTFAADLARLD